MNTLHKYQLRIVGEHFLIPASSDVDEQAVPPCRGFVTTRWIEAPSPERAARQAFALIRAELGPQQASTALASLSPLLTVIAASELQSFEGLPAPGAGFTFFTDPSRSLLERFREACLELWYRITGNRPWTYSEPFGPHVPSSGLN